MAGQSFVFTGALDRFTRSEAEALVESLGGRCTSTVSPKTDHVVIGLRPGSKADDARTLRVENLNEEGFLKLVRDHHRSTGSRAAEASPP